MINKDEEILICRKAIDTFGETVQKIKAIEEISELTRAIMMALQSKKNNVEEKIADVEIMLMQLRLMYSSDKVEHELETVYELIPPGIIEQCVESLNGLSQHICKELALDKPLDVRKIAYGINCIETLKRRKFNTKEIEEIKQLKLKRLDGIIYGTQKIKG